jgi:hypothetical protein
MCFRVAVRVVAMCGVALILGSSVIWSSRVEAAECYQTGAQIPPDVWTIETPFDGPFFQLSSIGILRLTGDPPPSLNKYIQMYPLVGINLKYGPVPKQQVYVRLEFEPSHDRGPTFFDVYYRDGTHAYHEEYKPRYPTDNRTFKFKYGLGRNSHLRILSARRLDLLRLCWSVRKDDFPKLLLSGKPKGAIVKPIQSSAGNQ